MSHLDPNSINMSGFSIDEIEEGMTYSISKTIGESDIYNYAGIIGDFNPVHVNEEYAKTTRFGTRIAHGMLTGSFISTLVGMALSGADAIFLEQTLRFLKPVKIGDTIKASATVTEVRKEKRIFGMDCTITNQDGVVVLEGESLVMATKE